MDVSGRPDIDAPTQWAVTERVLEALPRGASIVLLGNSAALAHGIPDVTHTKDVDVSVILVGGTKTVAPMEAVHEVLGALGTTPATAPDDRSWVKAFIEVWGAACQVDFIRGKARDRPHGTFIDRRTLDAIVRDARPHRAVYLPSLTDLIAMKAWAAVDQTRHLYQDPQRPAWHVQRREAYRGDAQAISHFALDRDELIVDRLDHLLAQMAPHRAAPVRDELGRAGAWPS